MWVAHAEGGKYHVDMSTMHAHQGVVTHVDHACVHVPAYVQVVARGCDVEGWM